MVWNTGAYLNDIAIIPHLILIWSAPSFDIWMERYLELCITEISLGTYRMDRLDKYDEQMLTKKPAVISYIFHIKYVYIYNVREFTPWNQCNFTTLLLYWPCANFCTHVCLQIRRNITQVFRRNIEI